MNAVKKTLMPYTFVVVTIRPNQPPNLYPMREQEIIDYVTNLPADVKIYNIFTVNANGVTTPYILVYDGGIRLVRMDEVKDIYATRIKAYGGAFLQSNIHDIADIPTNDSVSDDDCFEE